MPRKKSKSAETVGRKSSRNVNTDGNDERQEDAHRSEADWLQLSKEILVLKCNQYNLWTSRPKGHLAKCLVSFFAEHNRPMPSENEEDGQHEEDSTELAEVERSQPPEMSGLLASLTPGIETLIAQTLKSQEPPAHACRFSPEPGPSNDPRFTTHESSRSPGCHDTRGKRTTCKCSRAKKARPQARPPSKRTHSSSSDSGTYHRSSPLARPKRALPLIRAQSIQVCP